MERLARNRSRPVVLMLWALYVLSSCLLAHGLCISVGDAHAGASLWLLDGCHERVQVAAHDDDDHDHESPCLSEAIPDRGEDCLDIVLHVTRDRPTDRAGLSPAPTITPAVPATGWWAAMATRAGPPVPTIAQNATPVCRDGVQLLMPSIVLLI